MMVVCFTITLSFWFEKEELALQVHIAKLDVKLLLECLRFVVKLKQGEIFFYWVEYFKYVLNLYVEKFKLDENNFDSIIVKSISLCDLSFALYMSH